MAVILPVTYGANNNSQLISGVPVASPGLRLIDHADLVGPERTNRPLKNLSQNDTEINLHLNEITGLLTDGVFEGFGQEFQIILTSSVNSTSMTFEVREGLGKLGHQAFHKIYRSGTLTDFDVTSEGDTFPVTIPPDVTTISIDVTGIGADQYRRDLIVLNAQGQIVAVQGTNSSFIPAEYSQISAPVNTLALYSILFRKIAGVMQTPVINKVFNLAKIEGLDLLTNFSQLFGDGIFIDEPSELPADQRMFSPSIFGGTQYFVSAGEAIISGSLVKYGSAGNAITLQKAVSNVGTGSTPGATQGVNTNGWELVDFTLVNNPGPGGTGTGNTQYLKYDNTSVMGLIDPSSIIIYTASPVGEGGYSVQRPFDIDVINPATTEEYSIDITTGLIRREKATAPLRVFIKYNFARNRRFLPYFDRFGTLGTLQSSATYPSQPPEFTASQLPAASIGLKSILFAATDSTLQPSNFGQDFRIYMNFKLENGQVITQSIKDGAITGAKLAPGAISSSSVIGSGVISQVNLSPELLLSLSTSRVYARNSLAFLYSGTDTVFSFADHKDAVNSLLTKNLTDVNGNNLVYNDAELQNPSDRAVSFTNVFKDSVSTEVETDPSLSQATFSFTPAGLGGVKQTGETADLSAVAISFQDFGFTQVGNAIAIVYNTTTNTALATKSVALSTIKNEIAGKSSAFYKFVFDSPVPLTIGTSYQIRISKTIPTDTVFVHTSIEGPARSLNIAFRAYYKPPAGKYSSTQGYRIFDAFGDVNIPSTDRLEQTGIENYIPYAANISDLTGFTVFEDPDSSITNYIAVDVVKGFFKFTQNSQPITSKLYTNHNIVTGLSNLSSERIHRHNGLTVEHSLRVLETELGSIKANVTNHIEKLYYIGKSLNGTGSKFRFSSQDRQLTDLEGNSLRLTDGNLQSPIHVIDTAYFVPEGRESERQIQDNYNSSDYIEFVPRFDNVAIFAVNIAEAGTDYDAIQIALHIGSFNVSMLTQAPIASATVAKNAVKTGFNFFSLESDLAVGQTYTVLIKVLNFLGGLAVRPRMKVDVANNEIEFEEFFLPIAGKYGSPNGYSLADMFGDLNVGSEDRGAEIDDSQENFLDATGVQVLQFFDDNDIDPSQANTTFPSFSPSRPDRTGMVRFDIYFRKVPLPGEDGYNGVFRLQLHDSTNTAIKPNNSLPGQDYIDVRVPKTTGWLEIPFQASLRFGESYHMHIWANGADLDLFIGTHSVTNVKAFRFISGTRFIPFAADLSGDKWDEFEMVINNIVAVDVINGRIKFHSDDIEPNNIYVANFNLFTRTADVQSDTIVRPGGNTIEDSFLSFVQIREEAVPTRLDVGLYRFNPVLNNLSDGLGRRLERKDGELTIPYERITIEDTDTTGTSSLLTTTGTDNQYTFFIDHFEAVVFDSIILNYSEIQKNYYNTIMTIAPAGGSVEATGYIRAKDLKRGFNDIYLEDVSGNPLNFVVEPNTQYVLSFTADVSGPGTAPKLARNSNGLLTTTIKFRPQFSGLYGTEDGITIEDDYGDVFRYNINRDTLQDPVVLINTASGLANLNNAVGSDRGILVWQENDTVKGVRYDLSTGFLVDTQKIEIAGSSGSAAVQPSMSVYDDIAYVVWVQSGAVYGRRLFVNSGNPMIVDTVPYKITDSGAISVGRPSVAADRDRMIVVWEDGRDTPSGTVNLTPNTKNIFSFSFNNAATVSQFSVSGNANGSIFRVNTSANSAAAYTKPKVGVYRDRAVIVYESDIENIGLSKDIYLAVYDLPNQSLTRTDIRVDKAPVIESSIQVDSKDPKISNFRNMFAVAWLDDRNNPGGSYEPYGKIYDSINLTFNQSDAAFDGNISGVTDINIFMSQKVLAVGLSDSSDGYVKRVDVNTLSDHDQEPYNINFNDKLSNAVTSVYPSIKDNTFYNFAIDGSGSAVIKSRVTGLNIEPVAVDLSDTTRTINPGYIGIDVVEGIYKFADGEEI